jgi:hypothetical protein
VPYAFDSSALAGDGERFFFCLLGFVVVLLLRFRLGLVDRDLLELYPSSS